MYNCFAIGFNGTWLYNYVCKTWSIQVIVQAFIFGDNLYWTLSMHQKPNLLMEPECLENRLVVPKEFYCWWQLSFLWLCIRNPTSCWLPHKKHKISNNYKWVGPPTSTSWTLPLGPQLWDILTYILTCDVHITCIHNAIVSFLDWMDFTTHLKQYTCQILGHYTRFTSLENIVSYWKGQSWKK
jgi:hypothetical protein